MTKYTAKNVLLQLEDGTKVLPYTDKLSRDLSNITVDGENKLIASRVYRAKDVLSDVRGAEELEKEKRSTFDRSKFTVVGSPTITDDGIVTSSSVHSYVKTDILTQIGDKSWEIRFKGKIPQNGVSPFYIIGGAGWASATPISLGKLSGSSTDDIFLFIRGTNGYIVGTAIIPAKYGQTGNSIAGKISYDGTNIYSWEIYIGNSTFKDSITSTDKLSPTSATNSFLAIGGNNTYGVDLKQFSITADGVEVFNGNKTGIDQIKKDDYTVVGSPIISDDGIVSGFSSSNYLTIPNTINFNQPFKVKGKFNSGDITKPQAIFTLTPNTDYLFCGIHNDGYPIMYFPDTFSKSWAKTNETIVANMEYYFEFVYDGTYFKFSVGSDKKNLNITTGNRLSKEFTVTSSTRYIGRNVSGNYIFDGSIDLNAFKIYVDDQLVYQPTLRIPYTQSKTGNKIVDSVYRDRVQDMYEQFGYTHYYTLGDEPEKYNVEVVGSPTITDDGILKNCTSANHCLIGTPNLEKSWSIEFDFFTGEYTSSDTKTISLIGTKDTPWRGQLLYSASEKRFGAWLYNRPTGDGAIEMWSSKNTVLDNTLYHICFSWDTTSYKIEWSYDNGKHKQGITLSSTTSLVDFFSSNLLKIGSGVSRDIYSFLDSQYIDLKTFVVKSDGKEVFRGYEPAIPNAFTLPTNKPSDIIYEVTGADSGYTQYADLTVEQYGKIPASTTSVNLPVAYKDANYNLNVHYVDNTSTSNTTVALTNGVRSASSFTTGTSTLTRQYNTSGKIVLG